MIYLIWLSILNFKPIEKLQLIQIIGTPEKIFKLTEKQLREYTNSEEIIRKIINIEKRQEAEKILNQIEKENIKLITIMDKEYPKKLHRIYDKPILLYAKGNTKLLKSLKKISIIGSRNCSEYGKMVTQKLSYMLAKKDYTIVSGMAKGIDSYAHKGTLTAKGNTIAILGSGVNYIYPEENKRLYNKILEQNGLILSEYGIDTKPIPEYFPARNRLISGISDKILITEASRKSGTMITANFAIEQGKTVYAVPGNITSTRSEGTNELIKDGAILVNSLEDITDL
mgnify:FL=1